MEASRLYPFCLNSRRWITTFFFMTLPETCVKKIDHKAVDCEMEECCYFEYREMTLHLFGKILVADKVLGRGRFIFSKEEWENMG